MSLDIKSVSSRLIEEVHNYSWTIESFEKMVDRNLLDRLKSEDIVIIPGCCRFNLSITKKEESIEEDLLARPDSSQSFSIYRITSKCRYLEEVEQEMEEDEISGDSPYLSRRTVQVLTRIRDLKYHLEANHGFESSSLVMWLIGPEGRRTFVAEGETLDTIDFSFFEIEKTNATDKFGFLCHGSLEFRIEAKLSKTTHNSEAYSKLRPERDLPSNLGHLLKTSSLSDFTIQTKDEQIKVHKCILFARSAVFARMIEADMKEKSDNAVRLVQYDSGVVKKFVEFIYTDELVFTEDRTEENSGTCIQLLELAHVYFMPRLKTLCEIYLIENMSAENIIKILRASDRYDADDLFVNAMKFFRLNKSNMIQKDALVDLLQCSQRLTDHILASLSSVQQSNSIL